MQATYVFGDFRKGFDLIDHSTLLGKVHRFNLHPCIVRWLAPFLEGRSQYVSSSFLRVMAVFPREQTSNLFAIMVDELVRSWPLRPKLVDDQTILEIVPRNSPPVMNFLVNDVDSYDSDHKMILNSTKCQCIVLDFLDCTWSLVFTGNMVVGSLLRSRY